MEAPFKVERMNEEAKKASSNQKHDFSEYMWMADLESFDREVRSQIEEEDYIRSSIEQILLDEEERETVYYSDGPSYRPQINGAFYNETPVNFYPRAENINYSMGNLEISGYNQQGYYDHPPQSLLEQQNSWHYIPQSDMMPHHPVPNNHLNGYHYLQNGEQNGNNFPTNGQCQSTRGTELHKTAAPVSN